MSAIIQRLMARPLTAILSLVILLLALMVLSDRLLRGVEIDLTEDSLYTLSDETVELMGNLREPVKFTFYYSRTAAGDYPNLMAWGARVSDMLETLARKSPDTVSLQMIDPEPFSEAEDDAVAAGLTPAGLEGGDQFWFGLHITNMTDGEAAIPFLAMERERFLEYDLVKAVLSLDQTSLPKLALLSGLPMQTQGAGPQGMPQPWYIRQQLDTFFQVETLSEEFTYIEPDTDLLFIVHPPKLDDLQLHAIDQFVLKGGHAVVLVDPHAESAVAGAMMAGQASSSDLGPLLASWGAELIAGKLVGDADNAQRVGGAGGAVQDYLLWLALGEDDIARDDMVGGSVGTLNLATAGALKPVEGAATSFTPVISSSELSMLYDATRGVGMPDTDQLLIDLQPDGTRHTLAARLAGPASTAFPRYAEMGAPTGDVSEGNINVFLMADSDFLDDRFWVRIQNMLGQQIAAPFAENGGFVLNMLEHMAGSDALLGLRTRGIGSRPFDRVTEIRRQAESQYRSREEQLQVRIRELEARLATLQGQEGAGSAIYSPEQEAEIEAFTEELLENRKALREVSRNLRKDIEGLGRTLAIINMFTIPGLILTILLVRQMITRSRRRHTS